MAFDGASCRSRVSLVVHPLNRGFRALVSSESSNVLCGGGPKAWLVTFPVV